MLQDLLAPLDGCTIVPLERLRLPPHLDGSREPRGSALFPHRLEVGNDREAIQRWLHEVAKSDSSFRSYRLEAERCLLWATVVCRKPLSALNDDDIAAYSRFMRHPQPRDQWISNGSPRRDDTSWRPFRAPLSLRSSERALGILATLFDWLHTTGYLRENPWNAPAAYLLRPNEKNATPALMPERLTNVVSAVEWSCIRKALDAMATGEDEHAASKSRAVLYLAYYADLKPGEISSLRLSAISVLESGVVPIWKLDILERPQELREIVLVPPVQRAIKHYFQFRGIALGSCVAQPDLPVIACSREIQDWPEPEGPLSGLGTRSVTGAVLEQAAALAREECNFIAARRLSLATLQWLRHAFEVHTAQYAISREWCWPLIGASWLASSAFKSYLPPRLPLSVDIILQAFDDLQEMWLP